MKPSIASYCSDQWCNCRHRCYD